ncbi:[protein-PII] uridylyltransferase [Rhabdothermincola sediminis]|uniref:[protein-PII] uridylyltransferase n=1 Tax=Rhabdothermincola sediminis TaxID=2751370 RepID=UPI001AA080CC|nr:[protein-PII] uridylyltransferase [Rhabdothermincola sediminis]
MPPTLERQALLGDPQLAGVELCRAYSDLVDRWLAELYEVEVDRVDGVALVAVGGYGRSELSPESDIDLLLLHDGIGPIGEIAERIWYPIWDAGLKLGHAVRTPKEALRLAADDLDTATSMLSLRPVAGDRALAEDVASKSRTLWAKRAKRWLAELSRSVKQRHAVAGEVAFLLEPDLKDGRGGLRDVHAIRWAEAARTVMLEGDDAGLAEAYDTILSARVELHRRTGRRGDRLVLEEQDGVADALGYPSADELMRAVSSAARRIAWTSDEVWDRVDSSLAGPLRSRLVRDREVAPGVVLRDGIVELHRFADPGADPLLGLRVAVAAATHATRIERRTLNRLAGEAPALGDPWPDGARSLLVELLLAGQPAIAVIESLDQRGIWVRVLPEWARVRCRSQRNAYHTFTVDRHLCQAAVNAAALAERVDRPDLLVVGALLHDIGKGEPGDHTEAGIELVGRIGPRMGFPPADVTVLQELVRHHLLLADVAVRRDLSDPGTIERVASQVRSLSTLRLLAALTEADSLATGPAAWNRWKAELVGELVDRVAHVLGGGEPSEVTTTDRFPSEAQRARMGEGRRVIEASGDDLLVIAEDRPGMFSRVAGALALNGLDVLEAAAHSDDAGMAIETFRVQSAFGSVIPWERVVTDIEKALEGKLALHARLEERARIYRRDRIPALAPDPPSVLVDNDISTVATVIEVKAPDAVGVLYKITRAIAELDLDLRSAKVQTLGAEVIDSFYVCDRSGGKVTDPNHLVELERAILHALAG